MRPATPMSQGKAASLKYSNTSSALRSIPTTARRIARKSHDLRPANRDGGDDDPDEYGRVKVKYHWGDQLESWWARIAMPWAHNQMGFQFFPRKDSEVVIEFLDGNPERPIIVGAVYNGVKKVIYSLPDNKTQSGMRGTDPDKAGCLRDPQRAAIRGQSGEEFVKFFAQKDFKRVVVNDDKS